MIRAINVVLWCAILLISTLTLPARGNERATAMLSVNGAEVSVEYGRPALKGRTVQQLFAQLGTGGIWRLGADQSTALVTTADLSFQNGPQGSVSVPKGEYSLWARRGAHGDWVLLFNTQSGQHGTRYNADHDLVAVPLRRGPSGEKVELVTIALSESGQGGELTIRWGKLSLSTTFKLD